LQQWHPTSPEYKEIASLAFANWAVVFYTALRLQEQELEAEAMMDEVPIENKLQLKPLFQRIAQSIFTPRAIHPLRKELSRHP